jgi:hypothetical protein
MRGRIESLNAAVAGSILLFEASGQRGEAPPPRERRPDDPDGSEHDGPEEVLEAGEETIASPAEPASAEPEAAPEGPPADGDALLLDGSAPAAAGDGASRELPPPRARRARPPRA